jgi:hypothetical protein
LGKVFCITQNCFIQAINGRQKAQSPILYEGPDHFSSLRGQPGQRLTQSIHQSLESWDNFGVAREAKDAYSPSIIEKIRMYLVVADSISN